MAAPDIPNIKAIETVYKSHRFRSRLEARWAVFFDCCNIKYLYEPEGFEFASGTWYLPDFYLPELHLWIEVKGVIPKRSDDNDIWNKIAGVAAAHGELGTVLGPIPNPDLLFGENHYEVDGMYWDNCYMWCICPDCLSVGFQFEGRSDRMPCKESSPYSPDWKVGCPRHSGNYDRHHTGDHEYLQNAFRAAIQARFEHGETP